MDQLICDYHQTYAFRIKTIKNLNYDLAQISNDSETMIVTIDGQNQVQLNRKVILAYSLKIQLQRLLEARTVERRTFIFGPLTNYFTKM